MEEEIKEIKQDEKLNAESLDSVDKKEINEPNKSEETLNENKSLNTQKNPEPTGEAKKEEKKEEAPKKTEEEIKREAFDKERRARRGELTQEEIVSAWEPKTKLGKEVKAGKIKNINEILDEDKKILEPEIVDALINVKTDLLSIGQSKGKFGGGKRRAWRQTQRKSKEGNIPTFSTLAVIGDENGHVGIGSGKSMETLPARDKATRKAKLNIIKVKRDCAAFDCACSEPHTVPFEVTGKSGSVKVVLIPAPQGTGLVVANELKKILKLAGIKDVYSKTYGRKRTTFNFIKACIQALKKTNVVNKK